MRQRYKVTNSEESKNIELDFSRDPLKQKPFKEFIWNGEKNEFLTRTASSWAKILGFYVIFFAALIAFWFSLYTIFELTLIEGRPKYFGDGGIVKVPGMSFRPMPNITGDNWNFDRITFNMNDTRDVELKIESVEYLFTNHSAITAKNGSNQVECTFGSKPEAGKVCSFNIDADFGPCTRSNSYGFNSMSPCVFLKMNKLFDWTPEFYDSNDKVFENVMRTVGTENSTEMEMIWITCNTTNKNDTAKMGNVTFYPQSGFPGYFYPFANQPGYVSPFIAVHFDGPKTDVTITIVCKAWAKNIQHDAYEGRGATRFRMFISSGKSVAIALKSLTTAMLLGLAYSTVVNLGMY